MSLDDFRVLVVEDEYFTASDIVTAATKQGCKVIGPVANLADAQSLAMAQSCDAAIVDIGLGGEKAFPLLDHLIEIDIPVVLVTGYNRDFLPAAYGGLRYFQKPFRAEEVIAACKGRGGGTIRL